MIRCVLMSMTVVLVGATCSRPRTKPPEGTILLSVSSQRLYVEVVANETGREQGLMFRREMGANAGMLFVFPQSEPLSFWMRNTYIPLSIAFLDHQKRIINIEDMAPLDEQGRGRSAAPARYALEVNQGWFKKHGIKAGDKCDFELPAGTRVE